VIINRSGGVTKDFVFQSSLFTKACITASALGERQIFPMQIKRISVVFLADSVINLSKCFFEIPPETEFGATTRDPETLQLTFCLSALNK